MCGIAGQVALTGRSRFNPGTLEKMTDALVHRGPDGEGHWINEEATVGLGHRRLSIIDLSHAADQPMHYLGRYVIIFNGEIYNYIELKELCLKQGYQFKSQSDTEVLMALYDWKRNSCLELVDGMFAFAIWDKATGELFCARDRFGEKPFYYAIDKNEVFLFGSEMKCLWAAGLEHSVDYTMTYNYLSSSLISDPKNRDKTFYSNIKKLPAAHYVVIKPGNSSIEPVRYWRIDINARNHDISCEEAEQKIRELFFTSVKRRLRSDVPVGSSLSGGLDSSIVVSVIDRMNERQEIVQKTFSAQFPGYIKDEGKYQRLILEHCKAESHFVYPTAESQLQRLEKVMYHQEEPFVHASVCVQYEVFELAKQHGVTVLLDGQGADEVFAGYHYHYLPFFKGLRQVKDGQYMKEKKAYSSLHSDNPINGSSRSEWKQVLKKMIPAAIQHSVEKFKQQTFEKGVRLEKTFVQRFAPPVIKKEEFADLQEALYYETFYFGLETLLRYADRNSMANSREVRLPYLYHELVEFLFTLPDQMKIREGWTKWILRKSFEGVVPPAILWRKDKIGYEPPQNEWIRKQDFQNIMKRSAEHLRDLRILDGRINIEQANPFLLWRIFMTANTLFK
jgi:asparagine synthase (glutamine-hydrolysing)